MTVHGDLGPSLPTPPGLLLGSGRHGSVYRARIGDRPVAVKVPPPDRGSTGEVEALQRLRHPHVIDLVDDLPDSAEGSAFAVEYCAHGTLADRLRSGWHPDAIELLAILEPLMDALDHIHDQGWIHGDVSPANIGLRSERDPVLLDFATSRPADGSPIREATVDYAGPCRRATTTLDVRALAAVALQIVGSSTRWDAEAPIRSALRSVIAAADAGDELTIADLRRALSAGRSPVRSGQTMQFGPRPPQRPAECAGSDGAGPHRPLAAFLLLPLLAVVTFLLGSMLFGSEADADGAALRTRPLTPADVTLSLSGVTWSTETGVLRHDASPDQRWQVGRAGDIAAAGRWTCTDDITLGIYRPSTGDWFVFDSWDDDATSASPARLEPGRNELLVATEGRCDLPLPI